MIRTTGAAIAACLFSAAVQVASEPAVAAELSLNSTSRARLAGPYTPVPQQSFVRTTGYRLLAANDLGMHCGDLDDRIATILPPFNVVHAQVVKRGGTGAAKPVILGRASADVVYSAAAQANDPALLNPPVVAADGSVFKTNFWQTALRTYAPFYPTGALAAFYPSTLPAGGGDIGLPVPDVERLYLGDGKLAIVQQTMPSVTKFVTDPTSGVPTSVTVAPYAANLPQLVKTFETDFPLFVNFPFGYTAPKVKWFSAEGIPVAPFDDKGRENPYPLMRMQAKLAGTGQVVASLDTVVPVAGESDCKNCHLGAPAGDGSALKRLTTPTTAAMDPRKGKVIAWASEEWAADINILRLHDAMHGTKLYGGYDAVSGVGKTPVACQSCHYTPALDLLHKGPQDAHGLTQAAHGSMSHVMHTSHGKLKKADGTPVFPKMPPPNDARRTKDQATTPINAFEKATLDETCYKCHPGKRTECLRGTMAGAGIVCQDCHGDMAQVGDDFSRAKPGGAFIVRADYYTNPATPRVPWANEPGCGSCHTGDANSNLATKAGAVPASDSIRLLQAYLATDTHAKPIVPTNLRFAEPRVAAGLAKGNPQLYRMSVDKHGGIFCEGCHGSTHAEWPTTNPAGNDNVAAMQLQGHTGKVMECLTCHTGIMPATLGGPHGMHPVGNEGNSAAWVSRHGDFVETKGKTECAACHGTKGEGTPLARTAIARPGLKCEGGSLCVGKETTITLPAEKDIGCGLCHANPFTTNFGKAAMLTK